MHLAVTMHEDSSAYPPRHSSDSFHPVITPPRLANDTEYMENLLVEPTHLARLVGKLQATFDMIVLYSAVC
jgi:hypothetical protein